MVEETSNSAKVVASGSIPPCDSMKMKRTKPRRTLSKKERQGPTLDEMETVEWQDYLGDCERRERAKIGPSEEVKKLLKKK